MLHFKSRIIVCFAAILTIAAYSCSSNSNKREKSNYEILQSCDSIPQSIKNIVKAVYENDADAFADAVSYPLQRPYPLKDIQNKEEMKANYNIIVDDSLRNVLLNSSPADWQKFGWRGYSVGDGQYLWVDDDIYAVNYISGREKSLIDSLTVVEKKSLPAQLSKGWTPILTLISSESPVAYRIDVSTPANKQESKRYRLSVYNNYKDKGSLHSMPDSLLYGNMEVEGSANIVSYVFHDSMGNEYDITPDDPATGNPVLTLSDGTQTDLIKAYWHEIN